ncbi:hypothetical protein Pint_25846 [Pistacia integerrima]|uniref:Uncharacterized protein n=1 Tax=Pistacia integerrima TaxID=434235 RepID=A0ACC0YHV8_9ROSI|nr:hypothetical protein Pint_25846 [Pistacia integerrima]
MSSRFYPSQPPVTAQGSQAATSAVAQAVEWQTALMACCFDSALKTAVLFAETKSELPLSFLIFSFANLLTFLSLFLAKFIAPKFAVVCQVMEKVAVVSAVTAFIICLTIPFH